MGFNHLKNLYAQPTNILDLLLMGIRYCTYLEDLTYTYVVNLDNLTTLCK